MERHKCKQFKSLDTMKMSILTKFINLGHFQPKSYFLEFDKIIQNSYEEEQPRQFWKGIEIKPSAEKLYGSPIEDSYEALLISLSYHGHKHRQHRGRGTMYNHIEPNKMILPYAIDK